MRFFGPVGYGESSETLPGSGVWEDVITERNYTGDILRNNKRYDQSNDVIDDFAINNSISIVTDAYALNHFFNIKYVKWQDVYWKVTSVEVKPPRLLLTIGSVYNGPKA